MIDKNKLQNASYDGRLVKLLPFFHNGKHCIGFRYNKKQQIYPRLMELRPEFSASRGMYYLYDSGKEIARIMRKFKDFAWVDLTEMQQIPVEERRKRRKEVIDKHLNEHAIKYLKAYKYRLTAESKSRQTISTYTNLVEVFLSYFNDLDPTEITNADIDAFMSDFIVGKQYSNSYQRQMISAIKSFYSKQLRSKVEIDFLPVVKKEFIVPKVLAKEEVKRLIAVSKNLKHRAMMTLAYGCGLRIGELLRVKISNIDKERRVLEVLQSKGKKDRVVPISERMLEILREYYKVYRPKFYLFEGAKLGHPYSASSFNAILKKNAKAVGIKKKVHAHVLRHSYATHLMESGVDLRYIQELLGHKSSRTTEIYTYVSDKSLSLIVNPFDDLDL